MTTKVKPMVEGWDTSAKPDQTVVMITNSIFNAIEWEKHYTVKERQALNDVVDEIVSHSVQEAKAERDEEWKKIIACHNCNGTGRTDNIGGAMECIECGGQCHNLVRYDGIHIDDLLSTLTTKEDK